MKFLKKLFKFIFRFLLVIIILLILGTGGLVIWHYTTLQAPDSYLPAEFLAYLKINSIKDIYDNVIDLRAADLIFTSTPGLTSVYKALMDFKSNELTRNWLFARLLKVRTDLIITPDYAPLIIFDPGLLSIPTRLAPVLNILIRIDGVNYTIIKRGKTTIYNYTVDAETNLYFSFHNNLIFFSTKEEHVAGLYANREQHTSLQDTNALANLEGKIKGGGFAEIYLNSSLLAETIAEGNADLRKILEEISLNALSALSFKITNADIFLSAYTGLETENALVQSFLSYKPASLQVIKYLPESTNLYTTMNFQSFREILDLVLLFKGKELAKTIRDVDSASKLVFGIGIDQLLFDWIGSEAGLFSTNLSPEPVVFLKIGDQAKWRFAWSKIEGSLFFNEEASLLLDNVRVRKLSFPPFLRSLVNLFVKGLETPYFIDLGEFVFFSMNAEVLAGVVNNYKEEKLLIRTAEYREISRSTPQNGNLFLYYDLSSRLPPFLAANNLVTGILRLYEKGLLAIHFNGTELKVDLAATGIAGRKTIGFPGFPKQLWEGAVSPVLCQGLAARGKNKLIYLNRKQQLIIQDLFDDTIVENTVEANSSLLVTRNNATGNNEIFIYTASGSLYKFDAEGNAVAPFPVITGYKNSFAPVELANRLVFYSASDKRLALFAKDGSASEFFPFAFDKDLLTPPAFSREWVVFYPKSFSGEVYLTDPAGVVLEGWPRQGGGISFCTPLFVQRRDGKTLVAFLTQSGILNLWTVDGQPVAGFPVDLEGVFYANPVVAAAGLGSSLFEQLQGKAIAVINSDGTLSLVSLTGEILAARNFPELKGKNSRLVLFDLDKDGIEEVFAYGESNYITGLGNNFEPLPGFPVKGSMQPAFTDLNFDGLFEMVAGSFDGNVYAYTLNK